MKREYKKRTPVTERQEDRYSREANREDRDFEAREYEEDDDMDMEFESPTYIQPKNIPKNVDYLWIRRQSGGRIDDANWSKMRRKGWTPVPASRHPEKVCVDIISKDSEVPQFIIFRDTILCERPKHQSEREREFLRRKTEKQMKGSEDSFSMNNGIIPVVNRSRTQVRSYTDENFF